MRRASRDNQEEIPDALQHHAQVVQRWPGRIQPLVQGRAGLILRLRPVVELGGDIINALDQPGGERLSRFRDMDESISHPERGVAQVQDNLDGTLREHLPGRRVGQLLQPEQEVVGHRAECLGYRRHQAFQRLDETGEPTEPGQRGLEERVRRALPVIPPLEQRLQQLERLPPDGAELAQCRVQGLLRGRDAGNAELLGGQRLLQGECRVLLVVHAGDEALFLGCLSLAERELGISDGVRARDAPLALLEDGLREREPGIRLRMRRGDEPLALCLLGLGQPERRVRLRVRRGDEPFLLRGVRLPERELGISYRVCLGNLVVAARPDGLRQRELRVNDAVRAGDGVLPLRDERLAEREHRIPLGVDGRDDIVPPADQRLLEAERRVLDGVRGLNLLVGRVLLGDGQRLLGVNLGILSLHERVLGSHHAEGLVLAVLARVAQVFLVALVLDGNVLERLFRHLHLVGRLSPLERRGGGLGHGLRVRLLSLNQVELRASQVERGIGDLLLQVLHGPGGVLPGDVQLVLGLLHREDGVLVRMLGVRQVNQGLGLLDAGLERGLGHRELGLGHVVRVSDALLGRLEISFLDRELSLGYRVRGLNLALVGLDDRLPDRELGLGHVVRVADAGLRRRVFGILEPEYRVLHGVRVLNLALPGGVRRLRNRERGLADRMRVLYR